jgi:hypothetical protein
MTTQRPPGGLRPSGRALWRSVLAAGYELCPDESAVLREACGIADTIAAIERALVGAPLTVPGSMGQQVLHPGISELRMQRAALASLLKQLRLPDLDEAGQRPNQHREAAQARWARAHGASP